MLTTLKNILLLHRYLLFRLAGNFWELVQMIMKLFLFKVHSINVSRSLSNAT